MFSKIIVCSATVRGPGRLACSWLHGACIACLETQDIVPFSLPFARATPGALLYCMEQCVSNLVYGWGAGSTLLAPWFTMLQPGFAGVRTTLPPHAQTQLFQQKLLDVPYLCAARLRGAARHHHDGPISDLPPMHPPRIPHMHWGSTHLGSASRGDGAASAASADLQTTSDGILLACSAHRRAWPHVGLGCCPWGHWPGSSRCSGCTGRSKGSRQGDNACAAWASVTAAPRGVSLPALPVQAALAPAGSGRAVVLFIVCSCSPPQNGLSKLFA